MGDEENEELTAAYRLELARVRAVREQGLVKALGEIAALRTGQDLAARSLSGRVLDEVAEHADKAVDALIDAHFRAGHREPEPIEDRIRNDFLHAALGSPPAQALFSGRGVQAASAARFSASHAAACQARLARISGTVRDRVLVRRSTVANERSTSAAAPAGWPSKYEWLELLGVGGFARVYLARDPDGVLVAVKVADAHEDAQKRALREIDALQELNHPNIISLLDHASDGSWFVMPKAEVKLDVVADLGRIDGPKLVDLVRAVGAALQHAHLKGLVHRDLSPGNLLRVDDRWVVSDWGLAKLPPGFKHSAMTKSGLGTAPWAAPEVLTDPSKADLRADLFSLGRVVGWLVTGQTPEVNRPSVMPPASPWYDFVRNATQRNRQDRPSDVTELMSLIPGDFHDGLRDLSTGEIAHLLWTLHMKGGKPTALFVAYRVRGSDLERRGLEGPIGEVPRQELSEVTRRAADQIAEHVASLIPAMAPPRVGDRVLMPTDTVEHATHVVTSDEPMDSEQMRSIRWTREEHYPGSGYQAPNGLLPHAELTEQLQACVAVLDAEAKSMATRAINDARGRNLSAV